MFSSPSYSDLEARREVKKEEVCLAFIFLFIKNAHDFSCNYSVAASWIVATVVDFRVSKTANNCVHLTILMNAAK